VAAFDPDGSGPLDVTSLPGTFGDGDIRFELSQAYVDIAWAKKLSEDTSFGISVVLATQSLEVGGLRGLSQYSEVFAASGGAQTPSALSGNGTDRSYGVGLKVGFHHEFADKFSFGLMYQSKISMGAHDDYSDLLADAGKLDIPPWVRMGASWQALPQLTVSIDAQQMWFSKIDALANSFGNLDHCPSAQRGGVEPGSCLGGANGAGFGWADVPVIAIETHGAASFAAACKAGALVTIEGIKSIASSLGATRICSQALAWTKKHTVIPVQVSDRQAINACLRFSDDHRVLVEPACGAALAVLYDKAELLPGSSTLIIVCGGSAVTLKQLTTWDESIPS
jgi:hypothetical protein